MSIVLLRSIIPNGMRVEVALDGQNQAIALELGYASEKISASFKFAQPILVPEGLTKKIGDSTQLKTLSDIRQEVAGAASGALQDLEGLWRDFVTRISTAQIILDTDSRFLGAIVFPLDAVAISGRSCLNLGACLSQESTAVVFEGSVELRADCNATMGTQRILVTMAWRVFFSATAGAEGPKISLQLPSLGLNLPKLDFPNFKWKSWNLSGFDSGFSLPTLPGLPLKVAADANLDISYIVDKPIDVKLSVKNANISGFGSEPVKLTDVIIDLQSGVLTVQRFQAEFPVIVRITDRQIVLPPPLDHLTFVLHKGSLLKLSLDISGEQAIWLGCIKVTISIFPTSQPDKMVKVLLNLPFKGGRFEDEVTIEGVLENRDIQLLAPTAGQLADALIRHLPSIGGVGFSFRMPGTQLPNADGLLEVLVAILGAIGQGAAGLARVIQSVMETLFQLLRSAAQSLGNLEVLVVLDENNGRMLQLVLLLESAANSKPFLGEAAGFEIIAPSAADLALLVDLRDGALDAYVVVTVDKNEESFSIGTDLWFGSESIERAAGEIGTNAPRQKLITVDFKSKSGQRVSLVPFGVRNGQATFLQALAQPLPVIRRTDLSYGGYELVEIKDQVTVTATFPDPGELKGRLLPFLASPQDTPSTDGGAGAWLKQYIEIKQIGPDQQPLLNSPAGTVKPELVGVALDRGKFETTMKVILHVMGNNIESDLLLQLDARKMTASIRGGKILITVKKDFELLGMAVTFKNKTPSANGNQFVLDLGGSDPRLYLADGVTAQLEFKKLGQDTEGRFLAFAIEHFAIHSGGLDLDARLAERYKLKLNGLETNFTFDQAAVKVRSGQAESFRLEAGGKLPPALLGNVDVMLKLDFGVRRNGKFGLVDGRLDLQTPGNSIRSENTHFEFKLESLGVRVFEIDDDLHFCAFLTGSATFKPTISELADGMLQKLSGVELRFTDCPICGPSDIVRRELEKLNLSFVVALDEPMRASLFELFFFEVRSIGFEPRCNMFGDRPFALVIGGQVRFADTGDVVRAECDFHKLYIAPGKDSIVPRIRCEGLGLSLKLGSAIEIEGKVVAVDGRMPPNVLESAKPDLSLEANGFMGQGRVAIQGLPPFAASFGFVEIRKPGWTESKRAWFVYLEAQRLSYYFPLGPIPFYLREAGLGLGYHFTYVGIAEIDNAKDLPSVIKELDKIALTALEPAKLEAWTISDQPDLTLVARAMFSMSSASSPVETLVWKESQEKPLSNLLLLNAVFAMRKSTFMMTANAWLGYSYYDWDQARHIGANGLAGKQALSGYVVLAGARSEFLARLVSNPGAEIGPRLGMPQQFKDALKEFQYDATLYMRPGLLHFELGWPNRIRWAKNIAGVNVSVMGGAIFRVHDNALLAGLNLEGQLTFEMGGSLDAGCVGIAVQASVNASLIARIIGYLDAQNASNSLYYSLFSLQVNVSFQVSAWLEIDAWLCKITIHASFSFSLQIDVMAELAIQGDAQVGARMRATIAISIFGRSLGLSVGLGMNPGLVDNAAARVGRFMNLGLVQDTPSSVAPIGTQDQANTEAATIGVERREAREMAAAATRPDSGLAKVPHEEEVRDEFKKPASTKGRTIGVTEFYAVLSYPKVLPDEPLFKAIVNPSEWVYMTFLPRDDDDKQDKSTFYAAPCKSGIPTDGLIAVHDHDINFTGIAHDLVLPERYVLIYEGTGWRQVFLNAEDIGIPTSVKWGAELAYTQSNENSIDNTPRDQIGKASLTQLFFAAFRTQADRAADVNSDKPYEEPIAKPVPRISKDANPRTEQDRFHRQERGYLGAIQQDPADRRCHEARDFLLHKFASDLFELAETGSVPATVHAVHLGLTLLVPKALANALYAKRTRVQVAKRVDAPKDNTCTYVPSGDCVVFNPPALQFSNEPPSFVGTDIVIEDKVAKLQWALQWHPMGKERNAEAFVKHYRIVRTITVGNNDHTSEPFTVICASEEEYRKIGVNKFERILHAPRTRFTDDFSNLTPYLKDEVFRAGSDAVIRYVVTPVCVSDTDGVACSDFIAVPKGAYHVPRLKDAWATLVIDPTESGTQDTVSKLDLQLTLIADDADIDSEQQMPKGTRLVWRVVARSEAILPAGQYGSDAETQRSLASTIGAGLAVRPGDAKFEIEQSGWEYKRLENPSNDDAFTPLEKAIQDVYNPRAWTLFAQLVLKLGDTDIATSRLVALKLGVQIGQIVTQVSALECVRLPFKSDRANVLAPVAHQDMQIVPGAAALPEPVLSRPATEHEIPGTLNLHPEFGAVSHLSWSIRPTTASVDSRRYRLRSGFYVYALSMDSGQDPRKPQSWRDAKQQSEVRLLGSDRVVLVPGEIGEPSNWKMRYPSHAKRRETSGTWYSDAESYIEWPSFPIRLHPLPEPASELIKALLGHGKPDVIKLKMTNADSKVQETWTFSLEQSKDCDWQLQDGMLKGGTAIGLRAAFRALQAKPGQSDGSDWDNAKRGGWTLELQAMWQHETSDPVAMQDVESVPMYFERDLHPMLESLLVHMRRPVDGEALFEIDRRPAPIVKAEKLGEFFGSTTQTADPYGWAALDRLALGVTVRLFDSFDNKFVSPEHLRRQVAYAVEEAGKAYPSFRRFLMVEYLLQPGTMTQQVPFELLASDSGQFESDSLIAALKTRALAMVRLSVRPAIRQHLHYSVTEIDESVVPVDFGIKFADGDVVLSSDGKQRSIATQSVGDILLKLDKQPRFVFWRQQGERLVQPHDDRPGNKQDKLAADSFGRFGTWTHWEDTDQPSMSVSWKAFWRVFRNAMNLKEEPETEQDLIALRSQWLSWNQRFFEFAADPSAEKETPWPQYAFGGVEETQPVQAAADGIGRIAITLPEADGYAHRRAFALVPRWRYASLLDACGIEGFGTPSLSEDDRVRIAAGFDGYRAHRATSSIERTAPIMPQTAYSLGRIGDTQWWIKDDVLEKVDSKEQAKNLEEKGYVRAGTMLGKSLAFAMPHHPEKILDEDNVPLSRSLSRSGLTWQLGLHTVDAQWSGQYKNANEPSSIPEFIINNAAEVTQLLTKRVQMGDTVSRTKVKVVHCLPHWYRHTVHATASAGTVVAETSATYLAEAFSSLVTITADMMAGVKNFHPWTVLLKDMKPAILLTGDDGSASYNVSIPALRYTDTTDEETAKLWNDPISKLLDPEVAYDLEFQSKGIQLRPQKTVKPLARIVRSADAKPMENMLQVITLARDWEVKCALKPDSSGVCSLDISISPLSAPIVVSGALLAALIGSDWLKDKHWLNGNQLRVPGGWSSAWLAKIITDFKSDQRVALTRELWDAMGVAGVGIPTSTNTGLVIFPKYSICELRLTRPGSVEQAKELATTLDEWLKKLDALDAGNFPLAHSIGTELRSSLAQVLQALWPDAYGPNQVISLPWIDSMPSPETPTEFVYAEGSSLRHLMPELMSQAEFDTAKQMAQDAEQKRQIEALWQAQKIRAWDGGHLVIRATRGDAIALELPPVTLL